jgi:hypothetical protein
MTKETMESSVISVKGIVEYYYNTSALGQYDDALPVTTRGYYV